MCRKYFLYAFLFCSVVIGSAFAIELMGTVPVSVTSDTAAAAKTKAFNSAQRDVILRELRAYANADQLNEAVKNSSSEELMNIISSSSVASEKISDTSYSANISFVIDSDAAKTWMEKYSVQNWLPTSNMVPVLSDSVLVNATLLQPMSDWILLNSVARDVGIDLSVVHMVGNRVVFAIAEKDVAKLSGALRDGGWRVTKTSDGLKIIK